MSFHDTAVPAFLQILNSLTGLLTKADHRVFSNAILTLSEGEDGRKLLYRAFHAERFISTPRNALRPLWELVRLARFHGLLRHL